MSASSESRREREKQQTRRPIPPKKKLGPSPKGPAQPLVWLDHVGGQELERTGEELMHLTLLNTLFTKFGKGPPFSHDVVTNRCKSLAESLKNFGDGAKRVEVAKFAAELAYEAEDKVAHVRGEIGQRYTEYMMRRDKAGGILEELNMTQTELDRSCDALMQKDQAILDHVKRQEQKPDVLAKLVQEREILYAQVRMEFSLSWPNFRAVMYRRHRSQGKVWEPAPSALIRHVETGALELVHRIFTEVEALKVLHENWPEDGVRVASIEVLRAVCADLVPKLTALCQFSMNQAPQPSGDGAELLQKRIATTVHAHFMAYPYLPAISEKDKDAKIVEVYDYSTEVSRMDKRLDEETSEEETGEDEKDGPSPQLGD